MNLKKIFILLGILIGIIVFKFFYFKNKIEKNELTAANSIPDTLVENSKAPEREQEKEQSPNTLNANSKESDNSKSNLDQKKLETKDGDFLSFERMENEWLTLMKTELGENYSRYIELRSECEKEKMDAYKLYHNYLRKKYGDNFKYNVSEDQSIGETKVNEKYLKLLLDVLGADKFKSYVSKKDKFNETLRLKHKGKKFILIEY